MKVFNKLDINPTNMNLYMEAVTHSSFTNENPSYPDYERLEFLGDAVLEIIISEYLYKERHLEEGTMTRMRASYVCEEACATYAKEIGLDLDIRVGIGEEINQTILADVFEAFVAALYLDQGLEFTRSFVLNIILKYIENNCGWQNGDTIAENVRLSNVTVRHYMNFLAKNGKIIESINYETGGRPSILYKKKED